MWKSINTQLYILFSKKSAWIMWFLMFGAMAVHFVGNIMKYYGYDESYMYNPLRLIYMGGYNHGVIGFLFAQFYPFLLVIPASFAYFADKKSRAIVFQQARTDRKSYYISKSISAFLAAFIIYALPLYIELVLNILAFPVSLNISLDSDNGNVLELVHSDGIQKYLFSDLWIYNKLLYIIIMIALLGILTGLLAVFAQCISMVFRFRYAVFIFLPVYILLFSIKKVLGGIESLEWSANYFEYILIADPTTGSSVVYVTFMLILAVLDASMIAYMIRKDEIV